MVLMDHSYSAPAAWAPPIVIPPNYRNNYTTGIVDQIFWSPRKSGQMIWKKYFSNPKFFKSMCHELKKNSSTKFFSKKLKVKPEKFVFLQSG
jgi:uncharacterized protein (DUF2461 family)